MYFRTLILSKLLLIPFFLFAQEDKAALLPPAFAFPIQGGFDTLKLPALKWILEEGETPLSHEKLLNGETADARLIDLNESPIFPILAHRPYWFKIRLTSSIDTEPFGLTFYRNGDAWPFEPTFLNVLTFSTLNNNKTNTGHSGSASPASERDYPDHILPSMISGNMQANDTLEIWCKVTMAESCKLQVDMELIRDEIIHLPRFATAQLSLQNLYRGACFALFFIASLLFLWYREPVYLWFMIFQVSVFVHGAYNDFSNEIYNFMFRENPRFFIFWILFVAVFMITSLLQFGRVYINTKNRFPRIHLLFGISIGSFFATAILGTAFRFFPELPDALWFKSRPLFIAAILVSTLLGIFSLLFSKDKLAQFFCIGAILPFVSMLFRMVEIHILKVTYERDISLIISAGLILTMTLALAYRFRVEINAKEEALKEKVNAELRSSEQKMRMNLAAEEARRLSEMDRMKSNFFSNVTHELRTPLTLILSPLDGLLKSENLSNKEFTQLKRIQQNGQSLLKLTNEILDLSKLESSKLTLNEQPVVIYSYLLRLVSQFETYAQKKGINFSFEYQGETHLQINMDEQKMEKVVNNLLSNALKFTPNGGSVKIKLVDEGASLKLEVADTGRGIHEDDLPHVFNRFYQTQKPRADEGGTGIGLALVQEFAKLFGGSVSVESELGKGSTFTFLFPRKQVIKPLDTADALAIKALENGMGPDSNSNSIEVMRENDETGLLPSLSQQTVLVVEDNFQLREYIESLLAGAHQVFTAENGQEALDWLGKKNGDGQLPDLIISDVMMPIMDGFQFLAELKNSEQYCAIPVVMLTAKAEIEDKLKALRIGVDDYMVKPFVEEELLARVDNLLKNAQARQQYTATEAGVEAVTGGRPEPTGSLGQKDLEWLAEVESRVLEKIADYDFNLDVLGQSVFMSPRQVRRRLKQFTGLSFSDYLKEARFREARRLLEAREVDSVKRLAQEVGMRDVKYFSQQFKQHFGKSPSEYLS